MMKKLSFPVFLLILWFVFWATYTLGQYPMDWIEAGVNWFSGIVGSMMSEGWLKDLLTDGIIAGVGSVLVFLPNILILYFFISVMEDSGYMARAAVLMDGAMRKIGLQGRSFIPMVMGFGCNVPAIMAAGTIDNRKTRLVTMAVIPFMSCTGRLPVFVLLAGTFFPEHPVMALFGIYLFGVIVAMLSAIVIGRFIKEDRAPRETELPPFRMPSWKVIFHNTWDQCKQYLEKITTTILLFSIVMWFLGYFPIHQGATPAYQQEHSYIGSIGKAIEPAMAPMDFSWKMDIGLLAGVGAKEFILSTMGVTYSQDGTSLSQALQSDVSKPTALAFMVFVLLYFPCVATFAAIKNETNSWKMAILLAIYTMVIAWLFAFAAYHIGLLLWPV